MATPTRLAGRRKTGHPALPPRAGLLAACTGTAESELYVASSRVWSRPNINNDGRADILQTYRGWASIPTCYSTGTGFACNNLAATIHDSGSSEQRFMTADVNADGRTDVIQVHRGWARYPVCLSTGTGWSCGNWAATVYDIGSY